MKNYLLTGLTIGLSVTWADHLRGKHTDWVDYLLGALMGVLVMLVVLGVRHLAQRLRKAPTGNPAD